MQLLDGVLKRWPIFAFLASAAMLGVAHGFEYFGHLSPCHLCLIQRQVYWWAMGLAALAAVVGLVRPSAPTPRIASLVLACVFAVGVYWSAFHAGAEWGWWKAPVTCSSGAKATLDSMKAFLAGAGVAAPACDKPAWIFLGLSMAGWNFVASVGLVLISLAAALRKDKPA